MQEYAVKYESSSKKFWRIVFGTMVGVLISSILISILSLFFMIGIFAVFSSSEKVSTIKENSVLKINFKYPITERTKSNPFEEMGLSDFSTSGIGLNDILKCIEHASNDPKIKGIYLNLTHISASPATTEEIRNAILNFKKSGKFVYAYSEVYTQKAYYVATAADKIFMNQKGEMEFKGIAMQVMFYKGLLEKLDIDMQIIRHGQFKSAVEPFILDKMSAANREQMTMLSQSLWNAMVTNISQARDIEVTTLNDYANQLLPADADDAVAKGFIDCTLYFQSFEDSLRSNLAIADDEKINYISLLEYNKSFKVESSKSKNKIAVIYAVGEIIDGKGNEETIGSETLCKEIKRAYLDKNVKAIVLRVNSPGGSALASEIIWYELEKAKEAGKVLVTSMGDYAASGGYYISCNSDAIVAAPNTLTGSIGVFGMLPNVQNFLKNKLGITVDVVKSNEHADYYTGMRKLDEVEHKKILLSIEKIYETFTQRVAEGRNMDVEKVNEIGQGRVWTGEHALENGLVDQLGSIEDAILLAANLANVENYQLVYYPKQKDWITKLLNKNDDVLMKQLQNELGYFYPSYEMLKQVSHLQGIQARLPMTFIIE